MPADENSKASLLKLYVENRCSPAQLESLMQLLQGDTLNRDLLAQMQADFEKITGQEDSIPALKSAKIRDSLMKQISPAPVISIRHRRWSASLIAASVAAVILCSIYYLFLQPSSGKMLAKKQDKNQLATADVAPGTNKALLILANGDSILLDDVKNGTLAKQGNTTVIKLNSKLDYDATAVPSNKILYNTISTPRGGQYQVELPDGTLVWLNAASSLRFPIAFTGKERTVEVSGEAYFEVAKNKLLPFVVKINNAEVRVLGTHFNVMAYNDEKSVATTLLEGVVKFVSQGNEKLLQPGQQSLMAKDGIVSIENNVDVDKAVAWKNGTFNFRGEDIDQICRQLARWYDVDIINNSKTDDLFYAEDIPRNTKLSEVLKILQLTGEINFRIDGRKVTVMP